MYLNEENKYTCIVQLKLSKLVRTVTTLSAICSADLARDIVCIRARQPCSLCVLRVAKATNVKVITVLT